MPTAAPRQTSSKSRSVLWLLPYLQPGMPCVALSVQSSFSICLKDHRCKQLFPRIVPTHESRRGASGNFFGMCLRSWYGLTMSACSYHKVASWLLSWTLSRSRTYLIKALQLADERYHHRSSFMPLYATLLLLLLLLLANHVLLNHAHCSCIHSTGRSQLRVRAQVTTRTGAKRQGKSQREGQVQRRSQNQRVKARSALPRCIYGLLVVGNIWFPADLVHLERIVV